MNHLASHVRKFLRYSVLEIKRGATSKEVSVAFRKQMMYVLITLIPYAKIAPIHTTDKCSNFCYVHPCL
jgi:hypothetical protein